MGMRGETREEYAVRVARAEDVVAREWAQFQGVVDDRGRAACQDDWPTFHQMRISQFLTWPLELLDSYAADLTEAELTGRNLLTEKYARMMATTAPQRYRRELAPRLPPLSEDRLALQEEIIAAQVDWAADFMRRYPHLGAGMRVLRSGDDSEQATSFETYLRGELGTYSERTLAGYRDLVASEREAGRNLTEQTVRLTALLSGYDGLAQAEEALASPDATPDR